MIERKNKKGRISDQCLSEEKEVASTPSCSTLFIFATPNPRERRNEALTEEVSEDYTSNTGRSPHEEDLDSQVGRLKEERKDGKVRRRHQFPSFLSCRQTHLNRIYTGRRRIDEVGSSVSDTETGGKGEVIRSREGSRRALKDSLPQPITGDRETHRFSSNAEREDLSGNDPSNGPPSRGEGSDVDANEGDLRRDRRGQRTRLERKRISLSSRTNQSLLSSVIDLLSSSINASSDLALRDSDATR